MHKKYPIVCQQDSKDCGPCVLQSIIIFYGGYVSLEKIREDAYTTLQGTSVYHLINAAKKYGFDATAKKTNKNIDNIILPAIVHIKYDNGLTHFMVLYEIKNKYYLMDPSKGKIVLSEEEFYKIFSGVIVEIFPKHKIITYEKEMNIYNLALNVLKNNKELVLKIIISSILLSILAICSNLVFKIYYEFYLSNNDIHLFKIISLIFINIVIMKVIMQYIRNYYENHLNKNVDTLIYKNFINHIFNLPLKIINTRSVGDIMSRINDIGNIKNLFSEIIFSCLLDFILSIVSCIMLFIIEYHLALILCFIILLYSLIAIIVCPYIYQRMKKNIEIQTNTNSILIENIDLLNSMKNLNKENSILYKNEEVLSELLYDNFTFSNKMNYIAIIKNTIFDLGIFILNTYGFYMIYLNKITLIDLVTFNNLMLYFIEPIKNIISIIPKYLFYKASFNKTCDFINLKEEKKGMIENFIPGDITFSNVYYSYNNYENILDNLNLTIREKEKIMFKGKSGSGKSTICQMLQKTIVPSKGSILINNKNISDYSINTLRENITYIGQKEKLYNDTIKNNIMFYGSNINDFDKVCKVCLIEDIIKNKPFRYETGIDSFANNISGGEKQRIVLARALLKNSKILILDEALSELDFSSEEKIINNIKEYYPDMTLIYVSHKKQDKLFDMVFDISKATYV